MVPLRVCVIFFSVKKPGIEMIKIEVRKMITFFFSSEFQEKV